MIVTGKVNLLKTALELRWRLATVFFVAFMVTLVFQGFRSDVVPLEIPANRSVSIQITPITALGVAIGLFLGFRSNVVWDRYWEARTLWGRLINSCRTFPRQLATYLQDDDSQVLYRELCFRLIEYVQAFRTHLRDEDLNPFRERWQGECKSCPSPTNVPAALLHRLGERLRDAYQGGHLSEFHLTRLDDTLTQITDIQGGCERIKNTPIPPAFTYVSHRVMQVYCCLIPFGLVGDLHWFTPPVATLIAFAFLTLDQISDLIEQPFSTEANDLPLNTMTRIIEIDLKERTGERDIPRPLEPENGILL